jgi:hypothetical protein
METPALLPIQRKMCCGFLSPLKSTALAGFDPATFVSSVKYTNHYTTKATKIQALTFTAMTIKDF